MAVSYGALKTRLRSTFKIIAKTANSRWFLGGAIIGVFAFAAARGLSALPLTQYGFNIWIFLLIDLITTPPYVLCINNVIRGLRTLPSWKLLVNGVMIACSFIAPYLYLVWSAGQKMPQWTLILTLSIIVGLAVIGPIRKLGTAWKGVR